MNGELRCDAVRRRGDSRIRKSELRGLQCCLCTLYTRVRELRFRLRGVHLRRNRRALLEFPLRLQNVRLRRVLRIFGRRQFRARRCEVGLRRFVCRFHRVDLGAGDVAFRAELLRAFVVETRLLRVRLGA